MAKTFRDIILHDNIAIAMVNRKGLLLYMDEEKD